MQDAKTNDKESRNKKSEKQEIERLKRELKESEQARRLAELDAEFARMLSLPYT